MHGGRGTGGWVGPRPCTEGITSEWASWGEEGARRRCVGLAVSTRRGASRAASELSRPSLRRPGRPDHPRHLVRRRCSPLQVGRGRTSPQRGAPNQKPSSLSRAKARAAGSGCSACARARSRARARAYLQQPLVAEDRTAGLPHAVQAGLELAQHLLSHGRRCLLVEAGGAQPSRVSSEARTRCARSCRAPLFLPPPGSSACWPVPQAVARRGAPGVSVLLPKQGTHLMMCAPASQTDRRRTHHRQTGQAGGQPPRASQRASRGAAKREDRTARWTEAGVVARHARAELAIKQHARGGHAGASNSCFITASTTRRHALPGAPPCAPLAIEYAPHALAGWDLSTRGVLSLFARTRAGHEGRAQGQKKERQRASESICSLFPRTYTGSARGRRRGDQRSKSPPHAARARLTAASASAPDARKSGSAAGGRCVAHARTHARTRPRLLVRARAHDRQRSPAMRGEQRARR